MKKSDKHVTTTLRVRAPDAASVLSYYRQRGVSFQSKAQFSEQVFRDFAALVERSFGISRMQDREALEFIQKILTFRTIPTGITAIANLELSNGADDEELNEVALAAAKLLKERE